MNGAPCAENQYKRGYAMRSMRARDSGYGRKKGTTPLRFPQSRVFFLDRGESVEFELEAIEFQEKAVLNMVE